MRSTTVRVRQWGQKCRREVSSTPGPPPACLDGPQSPCRDESGNPLPVLAELEHLSSLALLVVPTADLVARPKEGPRAEQDQGPVAHHPLKRISQFAENSGAFRGVGAPTVHLTLLEDSRFRG